MDGNFCIIFNGGVRDSKKTTQSQSDVVLMNFYVLVETQINVTTLI